MVNKPKKGDPVSGPPPHTTFVSRGRLNGVLRQRPSGGGPAEASATQPGREHSVDELDTQTFEALYYRARLILGEPLPRPGRFQLRNH
jgi:hypothetical protein